MKWEWISVLVCDQFLLNTFLPVHCYVMFCILFYILIKWLGENWSHVSTVCISHCVVMSMTLEFLVRTICLKWLISLQRNNTHVSRHYVVHKIAKYYLFEALILFGFKSNIKKSFFFRHHTVYCWHNTHLKFL